MSDQKEGYPATLRKTAVDMAVCVPSDWGEAKVLAYGEESNPCGSVSGWKLRDEFTKPCDQFASHCHITLDA